MKIVYMIRDMNEGGHLSLLEYYAQYFCDTYEVIVVSSLPCNLDNSMYKIFNDKKINIIESPKYERFFIKNIAYILSFILIIPRKILYRVGLKANDIDINFFRSNIEKKIALLLFSSKLKQVYDEFRPDVFHSIGFRLENKKLINFFRNKKLIYSEIEDPLNRIESIKYKNIKEKYIESFQSFLSICSTIVVPSQIIKNKLSNTFNLIEKKIKILPWIIEQNEITDVKELKDEIVFGASGRLTLSKGFHVLIEAFSKVNLSNWSLYIAGDGVEKDSLEKLINEYNLSNKIKLLGWVKDKKSFFDKIDIFIHPSLTEGMPLVIIEAMYFKKPIIGTSVGSIPEMFSKSGVIVKPNNSDSLKEEINNLLNNKHKILEMINYNEFEFTSKYAKEILVKKLDTIYNT